LVLCHGDDARVCWAGYFAGERFEFTLRLHMRGDAFRRDVWDQPVQIPYGETASYGDIARRLRLAEDKMKTKK